MMRIVYLLADTGVGGGVRVVLQQARALRDRGHDALVVVPGEPPDWIDPGVPVVRADGLAPDRLPDADVLVATYFTTVAPAHLSGRGFPVHLCQGYEGEFAHLRPRRAEIESAYRLSLPLLAVRDGLASLAERRFGKATATVGQGVDPAEFAPAPHVEGSSNGRARPRVLVSGPLEAPSKGVGVALAAAAELKRRGADFDLVRVSQVPFSERERALGVAAEHHAAVPAHAMPELYRSCDVILAPCTGAEGFCLPVLEALSCGVPAVVTDVDCFRAYAPVLDWAAVAAEGDEGALADALERVLSDGDERERLSARGREVAAGHRFEDVAERIETALETWLRGTARPRPAPDPRAAVDPPSVVLWQRDDVAQPEWAWAQRSARRGAVAELGPAAVDVRRGSEAPTVGALLAATGSQTVGVVLDDVAVFPPGTWGTLAGVLAAEPGVDVVVPLANEGSAPEAREDPPHPYSTPSGLAAVAATRDRRHGTAAARPPQVDPFAYVARRAALGTLDPALPARDAPAALAAASGAPSALALGTYVHRWAPVLAQPRPDLLAEVPAGAADVLDVGCATGAFAAAVRAERGCRVVGIEADPDLAAEATARVDRLVEADVEALPADAFGPEFDCIVCGDVLEHLRDPWSALAKLARWLRPGGALVATVPNVGHWSIVRDLVRGRFDYVPFGLLCWSHTRFFVRSELEHMVGEAGLALDRIVGYRDAPPPEGEDFVAAVRGLDPEADTESLVVYEYLVVAHAG
jgi:glycosyltransferase involved in cell wall biosynthesis/SAM-dependent methyltransferase